MCRRLGDLMRDWRGGGDRVERHCLALGMIDLTNGLLWVLSWVFNMETKDNIHKDDHKNSIMSCKTCRFFAWVMKPTS